MRKCKLFIFPSIIMLLCQPLCYSQSIPPRIPVLGGASVDAAVTIDANTGIFQYGYVVRNSSASQGGITSFEIDITSTPGTLPASDGLSNSADGYLRLISAANITALGPSIVPLGIENSPDRWDSGINSNGTVGWSQNPLTPAGVKILPGMSLSSFGFSSHGPPGIRRFIAQAYFDVDEDIPGPGIDEVAEDQAAQVAAQVAAADAATTARGVTIGPVFLPSVSDNGSLIDSLISLKHQAVSLGWFFGPGADGIVKGLDAKLDAAKGSAGRGNNAAAANQLGAFMNELDAQKGKRLNDNAYFLLKSNAQFIISKLKP